MTVRTVRRIALGGAMLAALTPVAHAAAQAPAAPTYVERYRPQYHFSPATNWTNDPNGLVFYRGEYHLFYQKNPFGDTWGHMSWGHAVSRDLVRWQHLPVAIPEADSVMAFSGSAVVDWNNTSGFGTRSNPPLVAIYTGHRTDRPSQSQYIAYSTDRGRTWTRYAKNPVLDIGKADFRDPKVFWYAPQKKWVMVLALSPEHRVSFYSSPDLKQWTHLSDFGPQAATSGVWECPDLFELPVQGAKGERRWVLIVNLNPGGIAGGSGTQYFVGRFDGTRFVPDENRPPSDDAAKAGALWADFGRDFYAGVSWSDVPRADGRRIWIGWMNDWDYANRIPTAPWRSAMTLPRTLALRRTADGIRLVQAPVAELRRLRGARRHVAGRSIPAGTLSLASSGVAGKALEIDAVLDLGRATEAGIEVRTGNGERTVIGIDAARGELFVDRTRSGDVSFDKGFAGRQAVPLRIERGRVRLHVFVDWSSVEVFAGDGRVVITDQIFPSPASEGVALYATGGTARLVSLDAWPMASTWKR